MTPLTQIALLAVVILAGTFVAARAACVRRIEPVEQYRADVAEADAQDAWDAAVTDALRLRRGWPASDRSAPFRLPGCGGPEYPRDCTTPISATHHGGPVEPLSTDRQ